VGETIESFRERDAAYKLRRYSERKAKGLRPPELVRQEQRRRAAGEKPRVLQALACTVCGEKPLAKGLCYRHYRAAQRALGVPWACEGSKSFKARAARHGVPYEPVNRLRVFERDGWICGLCSEPVAREDASLDHVVPMSRGGAHSYANTQCSHLLCNIRKGARE
jgi:hypothetical protein